MSKQPLVWFLSLGLLLFLHCSRPLWPEEPPYYVETPMPDEKAELMAISLSGELLAPLHLYERIHRDLEQIRGDVPSHYMEFCNIGHIPKFGRGNVLVFYIDSLTFWRLVDNDYPEWDALNEKYSMNLRIAYEDSLGGLLVMFFNGRRHASIMAQDYLALPRFIERYTKPMPYSMANIYPLMAGDTISYLIRQLNTDCQSGIKWSRFWFYISAQENVTFVGYWMPMWYDPEFPLWWEDAGRNWDDYYGYPFHGVE